MASDHETLLRQWRMLRLVPRYPRKITARELTAALAEIDYEVAKRTIERDLQTLSEVFPLMCDDRVRPFGWSWVKDAPSFDLPGLSPEESLAIKLVEQYVAPLLPTSVLGHLSPHFKAADLALKRSANTSKLANWVDKIRVVPAAQPLRTPKIAPGVQSLIYESLLRDRRIRAHYRKRGADKANEYFLNPLALVQRGPVTYLISTSVSQPLPRLFDLHRFQKIEITDDAVERPTNFDLDDFIASGAFGFGGGKRLKLTALFERTAAEHLFETPLSDDQVMSKQGNRVRLKASVIGTPQLLWWLLGFGDQVEVLAPANLRAEVAQVAKNMSRKYTSA